MSSSTRFEDWLEWKERCALGMCSEGTRAALHKFALVRFQRYLSRYAASVRGVHAEQFGLRPNDTWHLFETHLALHQVANGKRYKDWLFARLQAAEDDPLKVIEGGAALLMRDVVREFLRRETSPPRVAFPPPPANNAGAPLDLEELLPGGLNPADEAGQREYERLATLAAEAFIAQTNHRERVALVAKELDISLAHPAAEQAAGCGKSMINGAYHDAVRRLANQVRAEYAEDSREAVLTLALLALRTASRMLVDWARSEIACAPLFSVMGQTDGSTLVRSL